jgi:hypothetical protein
MMMSQQIMTTLSLALLFPVTALASQGPCAQGQLYLDQGPHHRFCLEACSPGYIPSPTGRECARPCPLNFYHDYSSREILNLRTLKCVRPIRVIRSDNSACPWYDKCGLASSKGCSKCPEGFVNHGCTCGHGAKWIDVESYTRPPFPINP